MLFGYWFQGFPRIVLPQHHHCCSTTRNHSAGGNTHHCTVTSRVRRLGLWKYIGAMTHFYPLLRNKIRNSSRTQLCSKGVCVRPRMRWPADPHIVHQWRFSAFLFIKAPNHSNGCFTVCTKNPRERSSIRVRSPLLPHTPPNWSALPPPHLSGNHHHKSNRHFDVEPRRVTNSICFFIPICVTREPVYSPEKTLPRNEIVFVQK